MENLTTKKCSYRMIHAGKGFSKREWGLRSGPCSLFLFRKNNQTVPVEALFSSPELSRYNSPVFFRLFPDHFPSNRGYDQVCQL
ncbi:hypothetical protein SDC9_179032 [bioreactor metagenome]|uniref:Uncharacterized protein n=1 Tax=bioreactor metagenome TaxID=1076179 RepID=A0A645GXV2_9ZZZZ